MIQMSHGLALRTASTPTHTFRRNSGRLPHSIELRRGGEEFPRRLVQPALGTEADCMSCLSFSHLTFPNFYLCNRFHLFPCVTNNEAKLVPIWEMFSYLKTYTLARHYVPFRTKCHLLTDFAHFWNFFPVQRRNWLLHLPMLLTLPCRHRSLAFARNDGLVSFGRNSISSNLRIGSIFQKSQTVCDMIENLENPQNF